jgi:hypothetical protein
LNSDLTKFGFPGYDVAVVRKCKNRDKHKDREREQWRQCDLNQWLEGGVLMISETEQCAARPQISRMGAHLSWKVSS